jgi:hypothetical protein
MSFAIWRSKKKPPSQEKMSPAQTPEPVDIPESELWLEG